MAAGAWPAMAAQSDSGRVGFLLRVEYFSGKYGRLVDAGVEFVTEPRTEPHGRVAVCTVRVMTTDNKAIVQAAAWRAFASHETERASSIR